MDPTPAPGMPPPVKPRRGDVLSPLWRIAAIVAFVVLGLALTVGPSSESGEIKILEDRGVIATATVNDSFVVEHRTRTATTVTVEEEVTFFTLDGEEVDVRLKDCDERRPDAPGSIVDVIYDPEEPTEIVQFLEPACGRQGIENAVPFTIGGCVALLIGYLWWGVRWKRLRWKWRWAAVTLLVFGVFLTAAAFSEDCDCRGLAWTSAPMIPLGGVALVGSIIERREEDQPEAPAQSPFKE